MSDALTDARGVEIAPGDTVIWGFSVGSSIAMAEAVVLGDDCDCDDTFPDPCPKPSVSLTPSGRVRLKVIRRSYGGGEKPVVDVAPDRLVVLKPQDGPFQPTVPDPCLALPPSPLPTQDEEARERIQESIERSKQCLRETEAPDWWRGNNRVLALTEFYAFHARALANYRRKLKALDG